MSHTHDILTILSVLSLLSTMFLATHPGMIISVVSHLSFQLSMIKRKISRTLSNLLKFLFDYVPRILFIGKDLIFGWISLVEMETNFIG